MDIEKRMRMAAESILENEAIAQGLGENGAAALMEWGVQCAKQIAADTVEFEDDVDAEESSYPRMRALRKLLANVKALCTFHLEISEREALLYEINRCTSSIYGASAQALTALPWEIMVEQTGADSGEKIRALRAIIENQQNLKRS